MKRLIAFCLFSFSVLIGFGQARPYTIASDTVELKSFGTGSTLIIRNSTKDTLGFLFNTGHGITIFKRALVKINDSTYLIGGDTLHVKSSGSITPGPSGIDGLLAIGGITLIDSTVTILHVITWRIKSIIYTRSVDTSFIIHSADSLTYRRDLLYADSTGKLKLIAGVEDSSIAVTPVLPVGGIYITVIDIYGRFISKPAAVVIGVIPTWQQTMLQGDTTTQRTVINYNGGGSALNIYGDKNGFIAGQVTNSNNGTSAGSGIYALNDLGHVGQWFLGSSNNLYVQDGLLFRSSGKGGIKLTADSGRISFNRGIIGSSYSPFEMAAFETDGSFRLNNYKNNIAGDSALGTDSNGKLIQYKKAVMVEVDPLSVHVSDSSVMLLPYLRKIDSTLANRITANTTAITLKVNIGDTASMLSPYLRKNDSTLANRITANTTSINLKVNTGDTASMLSPYLRKIDSTLANRITANTTSITLKLNIADTVSMLSPYLKKIDSTLANRITVNTAAINLKINTGDTAAMLSPYLLSGSIAWPGIFNSPTNGVASSHAITFSPTLSNQPAFTVLGNNTSSPATPLFFTNKFDDSLRRVPGSLSIDRRVNGVWIPQFPDSTGGSPGWKLAGNPGVVYPDTLTFLGTTNLTPLRLKTNNIQRMKIDSAGNVGINTDAPTSKLTVNGTITGTAAGFSANVTANNYLVTGSLSGLQASSNSIALSAFGGNAVASAFVFGTLSTYSTPNVSRNMVTVGDANAAYAAWSSGTNTLNWLNITPIISTTATSINTIRGIYYNPTLTSIIGTTHIAIQTVSGNNFFGTTSGSVGIGANTSINGSAILDITSTAKGLLPPRMTTTQKNAIASPAEGLFVYDLTLHEMSYWNGTTWINL